MTDMTGERLRKCWFMAAFSAVLHPLCALVGEVLYMFLRGDRPLPMCKYEYAQCDNLAFSHDSDFCAPQLHVHEPLCIVLPVYVSCGPALASHAGWCQGSAQLLHASRRWIVVSQANTPWATSMRGACVPDREL